MNDDLVKRDETDLIATLDFWIKHCEDVSKRASLQEVRKAAMKQIDEIERLTAERDALRKRIEDEAAKAQPEQSYIKP